MPFLWLSMLRDGPINIDGIAPCGGNPWAPTGTSPHRGKWRCIQARVGPYTYDGITFQPSRTHHPHGWAWAERLGRESIRIVPVVAGADESIMATSLRNIMDRFALSRERN